MSVNIADIIFYLDLFDQVVLSFTQQPSQGTPSHSNNYSALKCANPSPWLCDMQYFSDGAFILTKVWQALKYADSQFISVTFYKFIDSLIAV